MIYLGERFPSTELHPALMADRASPIQPPVYYRGWVFDENDFLQKALSRGIRVIYIKEKPDFYKAAYDYAFAVLKELGLKLPVCSCINFVIGPEGPKGVMRFHLSIQANSHRARHVTDEEVERLQQAFGFQEAPRWYMSAFEMSWTFKKSK